MTIEEERVRVAGLKAENRRLGRDLTRARLEAKKTLDERREMRDAVRLVLRLAGAEMNDDD